MLPYIDWALTPCQAGTTLSLLEALISPGPSSQQPSGGGCVITSQECGHRKLCRDHQLMARSQGQMTQVIRVSTRTLGGQAQAPGISCVWNLTQSQSLISPQHPFLSWGLHGPWGPRNVGKVLRRVQSGDSPAILILWKCSRGPSRV